LLWVAESQCESSLELASCKGFPQILAFLPHRPVIIKQGKGQQIATATTAMERWILVKMHWKQQLWRIRRAEYMATTMLRIHSATC
jgi:hypothetical protein